MTRFATRFALIALFSMSAAACTQSPDRFPPIQHEPTPVVIGNPVQAAAQGRPGYGGTDFGQKVVIDRYGRPIARETYTAGPSAGAGGLAAACTPDQLYRPECKAFQ